MTGVDLLTGHLHLVFFAIGHLVSLVSQMSERDHLDG